MFCFQCEQTAKGEGCSKIGVCGKQPEVAALQDLLVHALKGLSLVALEARKAGTADADVDRFTAKSLFSTLTNVDFDPDRFVPLIKGTVERRTALVDKIGAAGGQTTFSEDAANYQPAADLNGLIQQGESVSSAAL